MKVPIKFDQIKFRPGDSVHPGEVMFTLNGNDLFTIPVRAGASESFNLKIEGDIMIVVDTATVPDLLEPKVSGGIKRW